MRILIVAVALFVLIPPIINYGLLTWHMPGVQVASNPWLSFLGSYMAIFSAWSLSMYQYNRQRKDDVLKEKIQKEKEDLRDRQDNRSFITFETVSVMNDIHEINANVNSKVIASEAYSLYAKRINRTKQSGTSVPPMTYIKFCQYGKNDLVLDCSIEVEWYLENKPEQVQAETFSVGTFEKGIEIYLPCILRDMNINDVPILNKIQFNYSTLRSERMNFVFDTNNNTEACNVINNQGENEIIYSYESSESHWLLPWKAPVVTKK